LFSAVFEVDERTSADGAILKQLDAEQELRQLTSAGLRPENFDSVAICLLNSYRNPEHEKLLEAALRKAGFVEVSRSSEVSPLIRFVPRCDMRPWTRSLTQLLNPNCYARVQEP